MLCKDTRAQTKAMAGKGVQNARVRKTAQCVDFHETLESKVYFNKNESSGSKDANDV